ncbi:MAG: BamA/TamA family outer membrane protein [Salibacteraceae bacterium]
MRYKQCGLRASLSVMLGVVVAFLWLLSNPAYAQLKPISIFSKPDSIDSKNGLFVLPLLYYTPDTRFAAGLVGVYYFRTGKTQDKETTRLSYAKMLGDYTQNRQLDLWSSWNIFSNKEKYLFKGEFRFRNFPDKFYGIGNNTAEENIEGYEYNLFKFKMMAMKKIANHLFAGFDYQFETEYGFELQPGGQLETGEITGSTGGIGTAVGAVMTYDKRDNVINAYSGMLFELSSYWNTSYLGGNFNFININMEFSKFWEVKEHHIIAVNAMVNSNFGEVPFLDMAKVGSDGMLRGYASNRYRDHYFAGTQVEYRFPLWWRFGMVVFTGVGDVFDKPSDLQLNRLKYSFGAGLRFLVNPKERLNVRFDYGFGRRNNAFYLMLTEAF